MSASAARAEGQTAPAWSARLEQVARAVPRGVAAFDADGTLWRDDIGDAFLLHLIARGMVRLPGGRDAWAEYQRRVAEDRGLGYAYATQLLAGLPVEVVRAEAQALSQAFVPGRCIASAAQLMEACAGLGLRIAIVSASPLPVVEAGIAAAGLGRHRPQIAAMRVAVDPAGRYTDQIVPPVVYGPGKVIAAQVAGLWPLALACGDSVGGDRALLEAAQLGAVVAPASGSALGRMAAERQWVTLPERP